MSKIRGNIARQHMTTDIVVGDMVRLGIWVCGEWQPMQLGKVVTTQGGFIEADVMGIHGGAPWIFSSSVFHHMLESDYKAAAKQALAAIDAARGV